jgi:hypothetical protein
MENTNGLQRGNLFTTPVEWLGNSLVDSISSNGVMSTNGIFFPLSSISPLSITPETLNLFEGFTRDFNGRIKQDFGHHAVVFQNEKCQIFFMGYICAKPIYIHQLQNLVFSLTNGEYVLKLKNIEK